MKTKHLLLIITIILLLVIGVLAYQNIKSTGKVILINEYKIPQNASYCEIIDDKCGPERVCEFQNDTDGTKVCLGKY